MVDTYLKLRTDPQEAFLSAYGRLGPAPFKEALYADAARLMALGPCRFSSIPSSPRGCGEAGWGDKRRRPLHAVSDRGRATRDATIWQTARFSSDTWAKAVDGGPLPETPVILSKKRWLAERATLAGRNVPLGLKLEPGEPLDDIAGDLAQFSVIALNFPKFSDGRAFSTASLLREKHGFKGELRAVGNVLSDQIPLMRRVGFDTFEVTHAPTRRALLEGRIAEVRLHYQPAVVTEPPAGTRPWLQAHVRLTSSLHLGEIVAAGQMAAADRHSTGRRSSANTTRSSTATGAPTAIPNVLAISPLAVSTETRSSALPSRMPCRCASSVT